MRDLKFIGIALRRNRKYKEALEIYNYVQSTSKFLNDLKIKHIFLDFITGRIDCLIHLSRLEEALTMATELLIEDPHLLNRLYNPYFIEQLASSEDDNLQQNICMPIFLKFYEADIDGYYLYVAYDNFLQSYGCETPKDFFDKFDPNDLKHITFLEKVCKHEVLYSSPYFADQEEMDLARIEVCNFLTSKIENYSLLEPEVSELLRRVLVRKGIKQIDYSKIYVDIKSLKNTVTKELQESFNRNVEIASLPVDQLNKIVDSLGNLLVYYLEDENNPPETTDEELLNKVKLTSYNRFIHFQEAFLKIRDKFLFNSDHGLDTYLSMRIRHGTLPGQIRSVFESSQLVTVWSEADDQYLNNDYLLSKVSFINEDNKSRFIAAFNKFSKTIDEAAEKLKSETIQIQTESHPSKGLFDYAYSDNDLLELFSSKFGPIKEFNHFLEEVINTLWQRTEECLATIRSYLTNNFTISIYKAFEVLEKSLLELEEFKLGFETTHEVINLIKDCRTAITVEIQRIAEWFRRSNKKYIEEFDFSILLDSSVNTLKRSFQNAAIKIENSTTVSFDGDLFPVFTDIFFYLLHNALKHSRLSAEALNIGIQIAQTEKYLIITATNNVLDDTDYLDEIKRRIERSKSILQNKRMSEGIISKEGGTGFPKIKKALTQDLGRSDYSIEISLDQDEKRSPLFAAKITFDYADIIKINNEDSVN